MTSKIATPRHFSKAAKKLWRTILDEYKIADAPGLGILRSGIESFQRAEECRAAIAKEGLQVADRFGQLKSHPLLVVEKDARASFLASMRALNFDVEPLHDRPGRPGGK